MSAGDYSVAAGEAAQQLDYANFVCGVFQFSNARNHEQILGRKNVFTSQRRVADDRSDMSIAGRAVRSQIKKPFHTIEFMWATSIHLLSGLTLYDARVFL